jgi:alpha-tubulin suppressor-like RCC1 family protein
LSRFRRHFPHGRDFVKWAPLLIALAACDAVFGIDKVTPTDASTDAPIQTGWKQVTGGLEHTCAIRADDTLWCWGNNDSGEVGIGAPTQQVDQPTQIGSAKWRFVDASYDSSCGIQLDGSLWCWGANTYGQLGGGDTLASAVPRRVGDGYKLVTTTWYHTCAIRDDDSLWCWGYNYYGQLGTGAMTPSTEPVKIGDAQWLDVSAGYLHTCGIQRADHSLWCWGYNAYGAFGDATTAMVYEPRQIVGEQWSEVRAGYLATCGKTLSGHVRCAGYAAVGQLGNGTAPTAQTSFQPVLVDGVDVDDWAHLSFRQVHACGVRNDGALWCWGQNTHRQLGSATQTQFSSVPLRVMSGSETWRRASTGLLHTCAIDGLDQLWCFGSDGRSQLGDGGSSPATPTQIAGTWTTMALSATSSCALSGGKPHCSGLNASGQLGDGTTQYQQSFTPVDTTLTTWTAIEPGLAHTCGIAATTAYCWGNNAYGQLGDGTATESPTPKAITGTWTAISASEHTCALSTAGAVSCWGRNNYGQVGNTNTTNAATPYLVIATGATAVVTGYSHTCALTGNGSASCWGRNAEGELGNTTGNPAFIPTPVSQSVSGAFEWIGAGSYFSCGRSLTKQLWCWGQNAYGVLGTGDATSRYAPVQLSNDAWKDNALGGYHACGIKVDGSLWCWGAGGRGQLGLGDRSSHGIPTRVGTETTWQRVYAGHYHSCATKTDGTTWCWGWNTDGQLGDDKAFRAPVLVP